VRERALPSSRALDLAVTTLVLNQARYLREWIEFHRLMGVQLFVIFDHGSTDGTQRLLREYIACGTVVLIDAPRSFAGICGRDAPRPAQHFQAPCQTHVFNVALGLLRGRTAWMGNFDVDEFLWTPEGAPLPNLTAFLRQHAAYQHVDLVGVVYGTGNLTHPPTRPVIQALTHRTSNPREQVHDLSRKMLYQPARTWWVGVHSAVCWLCPSLTVEPLDPALRYNHYRWKSREEQAHKAVLNGNPAIAYDPATEAQWNAVRDTEILYVLPALLPRLAGEIQC
jgi:hypothetical protein